MRVVLNNRVLLVEWQHFNLAQPPAKRKFDQTFASTNCLVSDVVDIATSEITPLSKGQAVLARGDNYNKNKGRKVSLARALKFSKLSKLERTEIWKQYFHQRGDKY